MDFDLLTNPTVKSAIEAMNKGDRSAWFACFTSNATLTDDGNPVHLIQWSDSELFGEHRGYVMSINKVEDDGLTIYAKFHSDNWGEFDTFMKFEVAHGKITSLELGQVD